MIIESVPYNDGKPKYDLQEIIGCMRHLVREIETVSEQAKLLIEAADDLEKRLTGGQEDVAV